MIPRFGPWSFRKFLNPFTTSRISIRYLKGLGAILSKIRGPFIPQKGEGRGGLNLWLNLGALFFLGGNPFGKKFTWGKNACSHKGAPKGASWENGV